jgi:uncharacterized protein YecE (DUF72 family)
MEPVRIGCSGWSYRDWRDGLYKGVPQRRWLERYAETFDTVEVNATFYRLPRRSTVAAWAEETPTGFSFAVKGSRYLTHIRRLADTDTGLKRFWEPLEPLREAGRLGPVLWQLPENFERDDAALDGFLAALPDDARHCFEFRHPSWFTDNVYAMLRAYGVALVIGDRKGLDFQTHEMTAGWTLVRFHHGHRGRRGNYSESELEEWAQRFEQWRRRVEIYAYFNNDWEVFAPRNARWLRKRLAV